jgi:hypothetical protein
MLVKLKAQKWLVLIPYYLLKNLNLSLLCKKFTNSINCSPVNLEIKVTITLTRFDINLFINRIKHKYYNQYKS